MSAQHTLGPWTHEGQGDITGIENDPANGCVGKVDLACVYLRTVPGRSEANARLIAAAPDLLEALKALHGWCKAEIEHFDSTGPDEWIMEKASAAIAKAEGSAA